MKGKCLKKNGGWDPRYLPSWQIVHNGKCKDGSHTNSSSPPSTDGTRLQTENTMGKAGN